MMLKENDDQYYGSIGGTTCISQKQQHKAEHNVLKVLLWRPGGLKQIKPERRFLLLLERSQDQDNIVET